MSELSFRDIFYLLRKKIFSNSKKEKRVIEENESINLWVGDYKNWKEASSYCTGYNSQVILEKCKQSLLKVKNGEYAYERDSVLFSKIEYNWELLTSILLSTKDNKINVIDFGGALGSTYFQHSSFFKSNQLDVSWSVIEQVDFVKCGNENFKNESLNFHYSIEDALKENKSNFILLSAVLPYLENPYKLLDLIIKNQITYVLIDKTLVYKSYNESLTKQVVPKTIYEAEYPCWILSYNKIKEILLVNYDLLFEFNPYSEKIEMINGTEAGYSGALFKINI